MNLELAIRALRQADVLPLPGVLHPRIELPVEVVKALAKHTKDSYLRRRLADAAEWNEPTLRIYAEDRDRLLKVLVA